MEYRALVDFIIHVLALSECRHCSCNVATCAQCSNDDSQHTSIAGDTYSWYLRPLKYAEWPYSHFKGLSNTAKPSVPILHAHPVSRLEEESENDIQVLRRLSEVMHE
eukprot:1565870-Amphidinium_carterae.2